VATSARYRTNVPVQVSGTVSGPVAARLRPDGR
jgi:hypothetical protein